MDVSTSPPYGIISGLYPEHKDTCLLEMPCWVSGGEGIRRNHTAYLLGHHVNLLSARRQLTGASGP